MACVTLFACVCILLGFVVAIGYRVKPFRAVLIVVVGLSVVAMVYELAGAPESDLSSPIVVGIAAIILAIALSSAIIAVIRARSWRQPAPVQTARDWSINPKIFAYTVALIAIACVLMLFSTATDRVYIGCILTTALTLMSIGTGAASAAATAFISFVPLVLAVVVLKALSTGKVSPAAVGHFGKAAGLLLAPTCLLLYCAATAVTGGREARSSRELDLRMQNEYQYEAKLQGWQMPAFDPPPPMPQ
jgi:hypothetical protein